MLKKIVIVFLMLLFIPVLPTYGLEDLRQTPSNVHFSNLENQVDSFVEEHINKTAPGVAVVVVSDGEIILSKGYGYADVKNQISVDPTTTVFEYASISKMSIWIAAMQLVEQGKLDLDIDVNNYLPNDFIEKANYKYSFTMRDLMNHSAGFSNSSIDLFSMPKNDEDYISLESALLMYKSNQIYVPGTASAYSNYSSPLAAFVVESIAEKSFYEYEKENIFNLLNMNNTKNQPIWFNDSSFLENKAKGYSTGLIFNKLKETDWSYFSLYPAGSVNGTAEDLAKLILALTPDNDQTSPLFENRSTLETMFTASSLNLNEALGTYHGFIGWNGDLLAYGHPGNTAGFSTYFAVVPEQRFGIAILSNAGGADKLVLGLADLLLGNKMDDIEVGQKDLPSSSEVVGRYIAISRDDGNIREFISYITNQAKITAESETTIKMSHSLGEATYKQVEPYVYKMISNNNPVMNLMASELHFKMENNKPVQILTVGMPMDMTPLPLGRTMPFLIGHALIILISLFIFGEFSIERLIKAKRKGIILNSFEKSSYGLLTLGLLFIANILILLLTNSNIHIWINYILLFLTLIMFVLTLINLRKNEITKKQIYFYIFAVCLFVMFLIVLWDWNFFTM